MVYVKYIVNLERAIYVIPVRFILDIINKLNIEWKSLGTSCPEAARLILLNPSGIDFIIQEEEIEKKKHVLLPLLQISFGKFVCLPLILYKNRNASIEYRLIVLGMFLDKLAGTSQDEWETKLPTYIKKYKQIILDHNQLNLITNLPDNLSFQMDMVHKLIQYRAIYGISSQRYIDCVNDMRKGLQLVEGIY